MYIYKEIIMSSTEKKRKKIIDVIYLIMIIAFIVIIVKYALGVCLPFVAAFLVAVLLQRPKNYIVRKTPLKKGAASAILVLVTLAVIIALVILLGASLVNEVKGFISYLGSLVGEWRTYLDNIKNWLLETAQSLPKALRSSAIESINDIYNSIVTKLSGETAEAAQAITDISQGTADAAQAADTAQNGGSSLLSSLFGSFSFSSLSTPISGIVSKVTQIPSILIAAIMSIVACCFMTADYDRIKAFVKAQFPENKREDLSRGKELLRSSLGKMGKAYGLIMLITFTEITAGLYVLKLLGIFDSSFIILIAIATAIVDIIPILGTGTVVLPWAAYSLIVSNYKMAIGLIIIYAIITVIRQIIEPKLVAGQLGLSPVVTITAMYFGLKVFGVLGMIVTPLLIIMLKLLNDEGIIHLWNTPPEKEEIEEPKEKKPRKKPKKEKTPKQGS